MNIFVAYESRGGKTKKAAEIVADSLRRKGNEVSVSPISEAATSEVQKAELVILGSWVEGFILFGVGPAKAAIRWAEGLPMLDKKSVAVFCTYGFNPKNSAEVLASILKTKGAKVLTTQTMRRSDITKAAEDFAQSLS
ncbi:MAG: flavodoxin domain-containing protein [Actinobacteria bacterium]|jgi:menaquinone-dependent protoporphyrinogen IX oxidase|nr:flavodoxin domain-containing protein [Actinomycetota bacterium]MCL6104426.1 flavodoxin domain-containing protein [Actinomycetota bacterium]